MLKRTQIRNLVVDLIRNKTVAGDRVFNSLPFPIREDDCPCILVYTPTEDASSSARHTVLMNTTLTVNIECRTSEDFATSMATLDEMVARVESLVLGDERFQQLIESVASIKTQIGIEAGGEFPFSIAILTVLVEYKREIAPITDGHFLTAQINVDTIDPSDPNISAVGPDGRIESVVSVVMPQN